MNAATVQQQADTQWTERGYFYEPIPHYGGKVLKCAGIACDMNMERMLAKPGMVLTAGYIADRITADGHKPFTDL